MFWSQTEALHNIVKSTQKCPELLCGNTKVIYKAKSKLHGTNAGVRIENGDLTVLSRTCVITPEKDNESFAKWIELRKEAFLLNLDDKIKITFYGEWCGPGIQKGTAINYIPQRTFAVFAAVIDDENIVFEPSILRKYLRDVPGVTVISWFNNGEEFVVDYSDQESLALVAEKINEKVASVERLDPWIASEFNVKGIGEGLVFYPTSEQHCSSYKTFTNLFFKAKGDAHKVVANTKPAQILPTVTADYDAFVKMFLTPARCEQWVYAANDNKFEFDIKNTGKFVKLITADVMKESKAEIEASCLKPALVQTAVSRVASQWYVQESKKVSK